ncbi:MFS transporter [Tumebacillus sp. ITR2]|uniref:MFS transporter n=1 Tax=Tumebacillus amylolyticus TaxID=2801339 RepID=A0ABS1J7R6_9BACL|nr:MFS transporter [Tumebacillus amylolyticus]MBL0386104.1 MFS transporter [Tumebacillus amylolyticus]
MVSVLRLATFRRLWLAQIFSETGDWIRNMALLFWVYQVSHGSSLAVSVITVCEYAPVLFVTPFAGVWVDRWNRVKTMIVSDLLRSAAMLVIALAFLTGWLPFAYVGALLAGCFQSFFDPARTAVVAHVVPKEHSIAANSLTQVTRNTLRIVGPMIGTGVFALVGVSLSFGINTATFLLSAICLTGLLRIPMETDPRPHRRIFAELREGFRYTVGHRMLRPMLIAGMTLGIGLGSYNSLQIFLVTQSLHLDESYVAILNSVQGVAMLTSALLIGTLAKSIQHRHKLIIAGLFLIGLGILLVAAAPNLLVAALARLIVGFGGTTLNIGLASLIQTFVHNDFLGRVSGILEPLIIGTMMVSAAVAGALLQKVSVVSLLACNGVIVLCSALAALLLFKLAESNSTVESSTQTSS